MSATGRELAPARHAWLDDFMRNPLHELDELIGGYAAIHPYQRVDAPDAGKIIFGGLASDDPAILALDEALQAWLEARRIERPPGDRSELQRWVRESCDALELVSLLNLSGSALDLRRRFIMWNDWAQRFVLSPARDLRARYWRTVALTQNLAAPSLVNGLGPFWREICEQAGARLPANYLSIGLLGLRRLPNSGGISDTAWVGGLAAWALVHSPSEAAFRHQWLGLKPLYPRTPTRWRTVVSEVLSAPRFADAGITPPAWWAFDPDFQAMLKPNFRPTPSPVSGITKEDCDQLILRIDRDLIYTESEIDMLMHIGRRYAELVGDVFGFERAIHRIGMALLRRGGDRPKDRAAKAQALAQEGIHWAPESHHLWSLLREALLAQNAVAEAEMVGWDCVRRDPSDPEAPAQLAVLIGRQAGRLDEAEALLRLSVSKFPKNLYLKTQLGELLVFRNRPAEAQAIIDGALAEGLTSEPTFALQARLLDHAGQGEKAISVLKDGLNRLGFIGLDGMLSTLERGRHLRYKSDLFANPVGPQETLDLDFDLQQVVARGRLRKLRFILDHFQDEEKHRAEREELAALTQAAATPYAALLAARYDRESEDIMPSFATAFERALGARDLEKLDHLSKMHPRLQALILVALALLGDQGAIELLQTWLEQPAPANEDKAISILRRQLESLRGGARDPMRWFVADSDFQHQLLTIMHDANEANLSDRVAA